MNASPLAFSVSRESLILVGGDSVDVIALARLLARATDGTVLQASDPVDEAIRRRQPGLVVVRSSPRRATRHALDALVRRSPCPVAIAPYGYAGHAPGALSRIGVALDGWDESRIGLGEGVDLALGCGAELSLLM